MVEDYSFEKAETRYKIETADIRQMRLYLNANKLACALYDIDNWKRAVYNNKTYNEGSVIYKGKIYSKEEWNLKSLPKEDYNEDGIFLKEKPLYVYTEEEIVDILDNYLSKVNSIVYDYME